MKKTSARNALFGAAFIASAGLASTEAFAASPYDTVVSRLDTGGQFLGYMDISQDPEQIVQTLQMVFDKAKEANPDMAAMPIDLNAIIGHLGIFGLEAFGASSVQEADGRFLNKAFMHFPEGRSGLFRMSGGDAHAFSIQNFAPADAVVAIEGDLDLSCLRDVAKSIAADVMGPTGVDMIDQQLGMPMGPIAWTWNDLLDHANTRVVVALSIDESLPGFPVDNGKLTLPAADFVIGLDGFGDLLDLVTPMAVGSGQALLESAEAYDFLQMIEERPPELQHIRPVVARVKASNQLLIASRIEYLDRCLGDGPKIASNEDFQFLTKGFPREGNGLSYVSKSFVDAVVSRLLESAAAEDPSKAASLEAFQEASFFRFTGGASCSVNEAEGVYLISREDSSYKSKIIATPVAFAGIAAAVIVPTVQKFRAAAANGGGDEWGEESYEEGEYMEEDEESEYTEEEGEYVEEESETAE